MLCFCWNDGLESLLCSFVDALVGSTCVSKFSGPVLISDGGTIVSCSYCLSTPSCCCSRKFGVTFDSSGSIYSWAEVIGDTIRQLEQDKTVLCLCLCVVLVLFVMMCFGVLFQIANPMVAECDICSTPRPLLDAHNR